ncbi:hypothetical protein ACE6H2_010602 [Prunus campanulata]
MKGHGSQRWFALQAYTLVLPPVPSETFKPNKETHFAYIYKNETNPTHRLNTFQTRCFRMLQNSKKVILFQLSLLLLSCFLSKLRV